MNLLFVVCFLFHFGSILLLPLCFILSQKCATINCIRWLQVAVEAAEAAVVRIFEQENIGKHEKLGVGS